MLSPLLAFIFSCDCVRLHKKSKRTTRPKLVTSISNHASAAHDPCYNNTHTQHDVCVCVCVCVCVGGTALSHDRLLSDTEQCSDPSSVAARTVNLQLFKTRREKVQALKMCKIQFVVVLSSTLDSPALFKDTEGRRGRTSDCWMSNLHPLDLTSCQSCSIQCIWCFMVYLTLAGS